jgi:Flp pilus assembly protein TadG
MAAVSKARTRATVGWRGRIRARYGASRSEHGAVLVEAAFVFPVFILLLFGMIEFGFLLKDSQTLDNMTRAGVRVGAIAGNATSPNADYQVLTAILGSSNGLSPTEIIIFDATSLQGNPPGNVPAECAAGTLLCNVYDAQQLSEVNTTAYDATMQTDFGGGTTDPDCGQWDSTWCAGSDRNVSETANNGAGPDYLGVYVSAVHTTITGFFPSLTLSDSAVMQLEPQTP